MSHSPGKTLGEGSTAVAKRAIVLAPIIYLYLNLANVFSWVLPAVVASTLISPILYVLWLKTHTIRYYYLKLVTVFFLTYLLTYALRAEVFTLITVFVFLNLWIIKYAHSGGTPVEGFLALILPYVGLIKLGSALALGMSPLKFVPSLLTPQLLSSWCDFIILRAVLGVSLGMLLSDVLMSGGRYPLARVLVLTGLLGVSAAVVKLIGGLTAAYSIPALTLITSLLLISLGALTRSRGI